MVVETKSAVTHEEKLMAVASHASLAIFFIGPFTMVIPLVIWLLPKSSRFVQFHAKQAFFYQLCVYIIAAILFLIIALLSLIFIGKLLKPFYFLAWIWVIAYGLFGAWRVWKDRPFRYIFVADFIEAGEK
ncbi:DUF4870 domain-containing protein [bacterium]|nr:DUF4870 domain-containing protein [bacterium]